MLDDWRPRLTERLIGARNAAGAWGYRPVSTGAAEPTALAALALSASAPAPEPVDAALKWLADLQQDDGAVPVSRESPSPRWPTTLALLAWLRCTPDAAATYAGPVQKALGWLVEARGRPIPQDPSLHDHDSTLIGWSWVAGTHSWIEPTGYAILALRAADQAEHPRVREGVEVILDRALPDGGWNYGNRRVLENVLRPFPATTGVALAALAGEPREACIDAALAYLRRELPRVRAPLSLAWGLIGMRAWEAGPAAAETWLRECAARLADRPVDPHYDALLLLAGAEACPLIVPPEVRNDG
jgi:hypothetical protein